MLCGVQVKPRLAPLSIGLEVAGTRWAPFRSGGLGRASPSLVDGSCRCRAPRGSPRGLLQAASGWTARPGAACRTTPPRRRPDHHPHPGSGVGVSPPKSCTTRLPCKPQTNNQACDVQVVFVAPPQTCCDIIRAQNQSFIENFALDVVLPTFRFFSAQPNLGGKISGLFRRNKKKKL